jgi:hypothetical protein
MTAEISREVVRAPLPDIIAGPGTTSSSALHRIWFHGRIGEWNNFERDALQYFQTIDWNRHRQVISYRAVSGPSPASLAREHFHCGDEVGVQSRFVQNVGQVMSAVSVAMGVNLVFADYKASQGHATGSKVPDIICMTQNGGVRILGEIKTPWVNQHDLEMAITIGEDSGASLVSKRETSLS